MNIDLVIPEPLQEIVGESSIFDREFALDIKLPEARLDYGEIVFKRATGDVAPSNCGQSGSQQILKITDNSIEQYRIQDTVPEAYKTYSYRVCIYDKARNLNLSQKVESIRPTRFRHKLFVTSLQFDQNLKAAFATVPAFASGAHGGDYRCRFLANAAGFRKQNGRC